MRNDLQKPGKSTSHRNITFGYLLSPADAIDRESSAVQCVACFFPTIDLLNMGKSTENLDEVVHQRVSNHITKDQPPVLVIHGDADTLVPLEQSERFVERAKSAGCRIPLEVREGKKHGWPTMALDLLRFADWLD